MNLPLTILYFQFLYKENASPDIIQNPATIGKEEFKKKQLFAKYPSD
jgi:hypothetical protein